MNLAIKNRRSIRRYQEKAVSKAMIQEILQAGILAPSSKNRQPWKFVVVEGESKKDMISAMQYGIERERTVSYTHLDVYKRQTERGTQGSFVFPLFAAVQHHPACRCSCAV